jgi:hypothetical protein
MTGIHGIGYIPCSAFRSPAPEMDFISPPYLTQDVSVRRVMLHVLAALLPGIAVSA